MTREENIKSTRTAIRYLEQKRIKEFSELFTENGKWIHPYHSGLFPPEIVGREEIYISLKKAADGFDETHFPIDKILPFDDPSMVAVRFTGNLKMKNGRGTYNNDYFAIFSFDEHGKILEWIEYYNPIIAAKAFGWIDKIK